MAYCCPWTGNTRGAKICCWTFFPTKLCRPKGLVQNLFQVFRVLAAILSCLCSCFSCGINKVISQAKNKRLWHGIIENHIKLINTMQGFLTGTQIPYSSSGEPTLNQKIKKNYKFDMLWLEIFSQIFLVLILYKYCPITTKKAKIISNQELQGKVIFNNSILVIPFIIYTISFTQLISNNSKVLIVQ